MSGIRTDLAHAAVDRGAAALDHLRPDWRKHISAARLDISHSVWCVLGQLYANIGIVPLAELWDQLAAAAGDTDDNDVDFTVVFGFDVPDPLPQLPDGGINYDLLDQYRAALEERWIHHLTAT